VRDKTSSGRIDWRPESLANFRIIKNGLSAHGSGPTPEARGSELVVDRLSGLSSVYSVLWENWSSLARLGKL
jgi:hypothetical protein